MKVVYILICSTDYEGDAAVAVYATEEAATRAGQEAAINKQAAQYYYILTEGVRE